MKRAIKTVSVILSIIILSINVSAAELNIDARSAILIEADTGKVLYELNADEALPPASVTKVMTMLLVMEAIDSGKCNLGDMVQVSEYAASMGGSQIFLSPGESMSVEDLLKSVTVASANDAAVALAEYIAGSEEAFVVRMNQRARELGMNATNFENTNGLDDTTQNHVTSARDIAIMSAELLRHPKILEYSSIWQDTIRDGAFTLSNTNRLIRFYNGANGLKTGSTSKAKFCISASAKRDGMQLIAVIMGSSSRDARNESAKKLLDYGFANYSYTHFESSSAGEVKVLCGKAQSVDTYYDDYSAVVSKGDKVEQIINMPSELSAPIEKGDVLGTVEYRCNGELVGCADIKAASDVERLGYFDILGRIFKKFLMI